MLIIQNNIWQYTVTELKFNTRLSITLFLNDIDEIF
jgi:hypothetical protein